MREATQIYAGDEQKPRMEKKKKKKISNTCRHTACEIIVFTPPQRLKVKPISREISENTAPKLAFETAVTSFTSWPSCHWSLLGGKAVFMCYHYHYHHHLSMCAGVWIRDIRLKTNLGIPQLNKLLKNMMSKKLIKAVKSVAVSSACWDSFLFLLLWFTCFIL